MQKLLIFPLACLMFLAATAGGLAQDNRQKIEFGDLLFKIPEGWQVSRRENVITMNSPDEECFYRLAMLETTEHRALPYVQAVEMLFDAGAGAERFEDSELYTVEGRFNGIAARAHVYLREDVRNGLVMVEIESSHYSCPRPIFDQNPNVNNDDYWRMQQ